MNAVDLPPMVPLNRRYDVARMRAELQELSRLQWRAQRAYSADGLAPATTIDWRILPLRSIGGDPQRTDPGGAGLEGFADTPYLRQAPYFAEILRDIPAPLRAVRLMSLGPGARVHVHRDTKCGFPWGAMRLHVPVVTNPGAEVVIDGKTRHWDAGQLWFGDFNRPHYVRNTGSEPRIHLVIDTMVTPELLELFPATYRARMPWADVLLARKPVPLSAADLDTLACEVSLPGGFPEWSEEGAGSATADMPARLVVDNGRLVLHIHGEPRFSLVHIGDWEFRLEGWTDERTLQIDVSPQSGQCQVRFRIREGRHVTEQTRPARPYQGSLP